MQSSEFVKVLAASQPSVKNTAGRLEKKQYNQKSLSNTGAAPDETWDQTPETYVLWGLQMGLFQTERLRAIQKEGRDAKLFGFTT